MAVTRDRNRNERPPLDARTLEQAALAYAGRYATTQAKLRAYLVRKVRERGWEGPGEPGLDALVSRMAALGYVDDRAFAAARAAAFVRRGYGEHRLGVALRAAGIDEADGVEAREAARENAWSAALRYAERRRIGPFATVEGDRQAREKALAAMLRAGHPAAIAKRFAFAKRGEIPEPDTC